MTAARRRQFGNVRRLPSGRYQARYTGPDLGEYKAESTFAHHDDAIAFLADTRRKIDLKVWRPPGQEPAVETLLLSDYASRWVDEREPLKPSTRSLYRTQVELHISPHLGGYHVGEITPAVVRAFYRDIEGIGDRARAQTYGLLKTILGTAVEDRLLDKNPCLIRGAAQSKRAREIVVITVPELDALAEAMPERLRAAVLIEGWCALRFGELSELRRKDVAADGSTIHVRRGVVHVDGQFVVDTPKTAAGVRKVSVPPHIQPDLVEHLKRHTGRTKEALLFPNASGGHLHNHNYGHYFRKAKNSIGRPELRPHDLRHLGATMAALSGASVRELMNRVGHTTPSMAMRYQQLTDGRDVELAAKMSALLGGIGT